MSDVFSEVTRFVLGTARHSLTHPQRSREEKASIVHHAIERGLWLHVGYGHNSQELLAEVFRERRGRLPKCIGKGLGNDPESACRKIEETLRNTGLERFEIVQLETTADGSALFRDKGLCDELEHLRARGVVGEYVWTLGIPADAFPGYLTKAAPFRGYMFEYNLFHRGFNHQKYSRLDDTDAFKIIFSPLGNGAFAGEATAVTRLSNSMDLAERRRQLEQVLAHSNCGNLYELGIKFLMRQKNLSTIVGATLNPVHLDQYIEYTTSLRQLDDASFQKISALHAAWFA